MIQRVYLVLISLTHLLPHIKQFQTITQDNNNDQWQNKDEKGKVDLYFMARLWLSELQTRLAEPQTLFSKQTSLPPSHSIQSGNLFPF